MNDTLSVILEMLEARSYVSVGLQAGGSWAVLTPSFEGLKFNAVVKGTAWLKTREMENGLSLGQGDCFILTRSVPFVIASDLNVEPVLASTVFEGASDGVAKYGGSDEFHVIGGKMTVDPVLSRSLLQDLPTLIYIPARSSGSASVSWLIQKLTQESNSRLPGSSSVRSHLLHVLIVEALRQFLLTERHLGCGWVGAMRDPRIERALIALHSQPGRHWTLVQLSDVAGMSRANFALRFKALLGTSPIEYLSELRMQLASRALLRGSQQIGSIASNLGFSSESAFSARFKRRFGHTPRGYRHSRPT
jgi:AraC-like DNA-binding protein